MKGTTFLSAFLGDTHAAAGMAWTQWLACLLSEEEKWDDNNLHWCLVKGRKLTNRSTIHDPCVRGEWQMIDHVFPHWFWQVTCGMRDQFQLVKCVKISAQAKKAAAYMWIMFYSAWDLSSSYSSLWAFYTVNTLFPKAFNIFCFPLILPCAQSIEYHTRTDLQWAIHFLARTFNNSQHQTLNMHGY